MPAFDCGYFMAPDYIDQFVRRERYDDEDHPLAIFRDFNEWWFDLPPNTRKRTPLADCSFYPYLSTSPLMFPFFYLFSAHSGRKGSF